MSNRGKTLVKGHALRSEGKPFDKSRRMILGAEGYPLCGCGLYGPWLGSDAARKQWHREHKMRVSS